MNAGVEVLYGLDNVSSCHSVISHVCAFTNPIKTNRMADHVKKDICLFFVPLTPNDQPDCVLLNNLLIEINYTLSLKNSEGLEYNLSRPRCSKE